jgi:hypothetical protein
MNNYAKSRAYMAGLTEKLASEDFGEPDDQLPAILRKMADEQVKLRKFRASINLRRAAQLLEDQGAARSEPS